MLTKEFHKKPSLNYGELENMGPVEKYEKYGKFPLKMVVGLLLVIFTTCQAVLIVSETNKYSRSQERFMYNMFIDDSDKRSIDYNRLAYLYSVEDVKNHVSNSVKNFYGLKSKSLEIVQFSSADPIVRMEFEYIDNNRIQNLMKMKKAKNINNINNIENLQNELTKSNSDLILNENIPKQFHYEITNKTIGPFDYNNEDIKDFLNDVVEFRLNYTMMTYVPYFYSNNYDCSKWTVTQHYNFAGRGHFIVKLDIVRYSCQDYTGGHSFSDLFVNKLLWIHLIVLILAVISLIQTWSYISWIANLYMKVKSKHKQRLKTEDDEAYYTRSEDSIYYNPLLDENLRRQVEDEKEKVKMAEMSSQTSIMRSQTDNVRKRSQYKFKKPQEEIKQSPTFNGWYLISLTGNIFQMFGSAISIFDTNNILPSTEVLVGFGCMLAFLNIGRYIEYSQNYSTIYTTIKNSLPHVSRYLIGVTPIFLGFLFFGLCLFWRSERFTNTSNVMITLFSLSNGDSIYSTFKDLSGVYFFIGQIYLYLFCIIFIVVVLNIFIAIIEEVYITSKMESKTHWVFDYIQKDKKQTLQFKPPTEEMTLKKPPKTTKIFSDNNLPKKVNFKKEILNIDRDMSIPSFNNEGKSFRSVEDEKDEYSAYQKKIENEFSSIEDDLKSIMQLSTDIKESGDEHLIDEIRILVLERINSSVLMKTHDLRNEVNKWN